MESDKKIEWLRKVLHLQTKNGIACFYCGVPAEEKDHSVPISYLDELKRLRDLGVKLDIPEQKMIDTCIECNRIAGGRFLGTPLQRKIYIKTEIRKKYKKLLDSPDWEDEDIEELDGRLQEYVVLYQEAKKLIKQRLIY